MNQSERRDSNSRLSAWEADALPTELLSLTLLIIIQATVSQLPYYKVTNKNE